MDRLEINRYSEKFLLVIVIMSGFILILMMGALFYRSLPVLQSQSLFSLLLSQGWHPSRGAFGFLPFIAGSLWVTAVAMLIAMPVCLLTSIYLVEYSSRILRDIVSPFIDILAGIPSVVYGIWGILIVVPLIKDYIAPFFGVSSTGYSVLAGGVILAIMIFPVIIHITMEVLKTVPYELKAASLALGATKWQTVKNVIMRRAMPGIVAAMVLGLSRAFGESIAVLMVVGNLARIPKSLFDPAYPLPALIANNYGEMFSIPRYDSALLFAALLLLLVVLYFNIVSRMVLSGIKWSNYYYA